MPDIVSIVSKLDTQPYLFAGSGISKRYLNLPSWEELLRIFALRVRDDEFALVSYFDKAGHPGEKAAKYAEAAALIEADFNERWFDEPPFRKLSGKYLNFVKKGHSPFKAEIAYYLASSAKINAERHAEIERLKTILHKGITGIITTNYDLFFEELTKGFNEQHKVFIGQEEIILSTLQGWGEIYKIHGCISNPNSLVITTSDYAEFSRRSQGLAAKLMTVFLEHPIIFLGYSITDPNIQRILESIVECCNTQHLLDRLKERFIYVEWVPGLCNAEINTVLIKLNGGKSIEVTQVKTDDFLPLFEALSLKKNKIPAGLLRMFREEFYSYATTNKPTAHIRVVVGIDDGRVQDRDLVMAIGTPSRFGLVGLSGLQYVEWLKHIVLDTLEFTADELLDYAFPHLNRSNYRLPMHKLLSQAKKEHPQCIEKADKSFESILCRSIKNARGRLRGERSVSGILNSRNDIIDAMNSIAHLYEHEIDVNELGDFLASKLKDDTFYGSLKQRTPFNRLVRIYDWLKYGKKAGTLPLE